MEREIRASTSGWPIHTAAADRALRKFIKPRLPELFVAAGGRNAVARREGRSFVLDLIPHQDWSKRIDGNRATVRYDPSVPYWSSPTAASYPNGEGFDVLFAHIRRLRSSLPAECEQCGRVFRPADDASGFDRLCAFIGSALLKKVGAI